MDIETLQNKINELRQQRKVLYKDLHKKKDLIYKNDKYKNDEAYREAKKAKARQYYYDKVQPLRKPKTNTPETSEDKE